MQRIFIPDNGIERFIEKDDLLLVTGTSHKGRYAYLGIFKEPISVDDPCGVILSRSYLFRTDERLGGFQFPVIIPQMKDHKWLSLVHKQDLVVGKDEIVKSLKKDDQLAMYAPFVERLQKPYIR